MLLFIAEGHRGGRITQRSGGRIMFNQFIQDMIHMTEGEKLINYWPLWVTIIGIVGIGIIIIKRRK